MMLTMSLSCSKSEDEVVVTPLRDYAVQRDSDMLVIEKYLSDYTFTVTNNPGSNNDKDILFSKITNPSTQPSIKSLEASTTFPKLLNKIVTYDNIDYKLYYLVISEGNTNNKPSRVDEVLTSYRGIYLENNSGSLNTIEEFEYNPYPTSLFSLTSVIRGWTEIFPKFGIGEIDTTSSSAGPAVYKNFGVGAIFIPSGLAYFNAPPATSNIKAYSPLVFSFKLYDLKRSDLDINSNSALGDGILSIDEDLNGNGIFTDDDSDADGIPDYRDNDDDNDGYTTRDEIKKTNGTYYIFNDIPDCSGNFILPTRTRKHLDKNCH
jgi:FKBP-type peptidyl-prolyl cis-trans isomerase